MNSSKIVVGALVKLMTPSPFIIGGETNDWVDLSNRHGLGLAISVDNVERMVTVLWSGPAPSNVIEVEFIDTLQVV